MGWSIGYDNTHKRDIGYGVPAICDHPGCNAEINRGLAYICGEEIHGGEKGCGLFFCSHHRYFSESDDDPKLCMACCDDEPEFHPKPDTTEWMKWKLTDNSWQKWRDENPEETLKLTALAGDL